MKYIPKHIVLFPDGNRRWAKKNMLDVSGGYKKGYENLLNFSEWCKNRGVKVLTAFGFSTENWNRSEKEVDYLMKLFENCLSDNIERYVRDGVRVRVIGQRERLPKSLQKAILKTEYATKNNSNLFLNLAISYGGKWDILNAVKNIIKEACLPAGRGLNPDQITEQIFENYLSTAGLPAPDFVIRTGGEMRMSNFVLWQAAYSELYFCPKYWPDFTEKDLDSAFSEFEKRARRFGK